jgi:hypothetical protein
LSTIAETNSKGLDAFNTDVKNNFQIEEERGGTPSTIIARTHHIKYIL